MPPLTEPVPPQTAQALRRAVLGLRATERRRLFAPVLRLGDPGANETVWALRADEPMDRALRADVAAALLRRAAMRTPESPLAWLTRTGHLAWHDADADWLPAVAAAYAEADIPLTFVVVTRQGWWDPRSDVRRVWKRLRQR